MFELTLLIKVFAAHFIGDFAFQSAWMAENKGKSYEINFYHTATYTSAFVLLGTNFTPLQFLLVFISHYVIDLAKARWGIVKHIWLDQLLHFATILFILSIRT